MADTQRMEEKREALLARKRRLIRVAMGEEPADLVLKNAVYVNVFSHELCRADIAVAGDRIAGLGAYHGREEYDMTGRVILPGLIDAHIHLESALVSPREFARAVLPRGTTTVIVDPHEIANVMGADGIAYMLQATEGLPVDVRVMLPSCVPATPQDESGAELDWQAIDGFYDHPRVNGLAEMMNYPGVAAAQPAVLDKLAAAEARGRTVDGHAPFLRDRELNAYAAAGICSDHECCQLQDALDKLRLGQFIMIREGTAARNLEALAPLLAQPYGERCLFCTDDRHPDDLLEQGHIDHMIRRAAALGVDPILAVKAATCNAARYAGLSDRGAVAPGRLADLVAVNDLREASVEMVFRRGQLWWDGGWRQPMPCPAVDPRLAARARDTFRVRPLTAEDFLAQPRRGVIGMTPGQLTTVNLGWADQPRPEEDLLHVAVIERHRGTGRVGLGYLRGYGLRRGAVATSVAHDSHNIIVVGASEADMAAAVNRVAENRGGMAVACDGAIRAQVKLEVAGLMTDRPVEQVSGELTTAVQTARALGVFPGVDPFMSLSFMALPVIPALRITTRGVFDVEAQRYVQPSEM